jgi:glutamine amidotransferase
MLFEHSEEGNVAGLGVFAGRVRRFTAEKMVSPLGEKLKVPHMGWNEVVQTRSHALWEGIEDGSRFYFVHSYYVDPVQGHDISGTTNYGIPFTSAVARDNIFAIQCHPEKSAQAGLAMLSNFVRWNP